jgi:hypothetical protein
MENHPIIKGAQLAKHTTLSDGEENKKKHDRANGECMHCFSTLSQKQGLLCLKYRIGVCKGLEEKKQRPGS